MNKHASTHLFSQVPAADIQRSSFDRSHGYKTTFDADFLVPIFVDEALPGDTFNLDMSAFVRLATPIKPIMDNIELETFFFAVPNRLIWDNWEKFNGAQTNPGDTTDYLIPQVTAGSTTGIPNGTLFDYMGVPTLVPNIKFSALPGRASNLIWNEWFRDQNLQNSLTVPTGDAESTIIEYPLNRRGKRHDYFTSCLPWPQKGNPVSIGLAGKIPVTPLSAGNTEPVFGYLGSPSQNVKLGYGLTTNNLNVQGLDGTNTNNANDYFYWKDPKLEVNLSTATAISINDLREAFQIQRMLEKDARGGTRYTEIIRAHFGVTSPDARLQRPEYLGGGRSWININPVAQTQATPDAADTTPQGNLAAMGTAGVHRHGFTKSFTEHCTILGFMCARADLSYIQGLNRMWSRRTRYEFYWPTLSHLGEQAVLLKEIYAKGTAADDTVFGYQERFAEYRYKPSVITGKFRPNDPQTLDYWHLGENFATAPALNSAFIQSSSQFQIDRAIAVPSEPQFLMDAHFKFRCARPMPLYGVPGLVDHF